MCGCLLTLPPSSVGATAGKYLLSMALAKGFATCGGVSYSLVENPWFREFCRIQSQMAHEGQPWRPCGRDAVGKFVLKADKEEDAEAKQCFVDSYKGKSYLKTSDGWRSIQKMQLYSDVDVDASGQIRLVNCEDISKYHKTKEWFTAWMVPTSPHPQPPPPCCCYAAPHAARAAAAHTTTPPHIPTQPPSPRTPPVRADCIAPDQQGQEH